MSVSSDSVAAPPSAAHGLLGGLPARCQQAFRQASRIGREIAAAPTTIHGKDFDPDRAARSVVVDVDGVFDLIRLGNRRIGEREVGGVDSETW